MADVIQATDRAISQQQNIRRRATRQYAGHQPNIAPIPVSSRYSASLEGSELIELAHVFSRLEEQILSIAIDVMQNDTRDPDSRGPDEQQRIIQLDTVRRDLLDVYSGTHQFSAGYLKSQEFFREWKFAYNVHRELFRIGKEQGDQNNTQLAISAAKTIERFALPLPNALELAASRGTLDILTKNTIGDKYSQLDGIISLLCEYSDHVRSLPTWDKVSKSLGELSASATPVSSSIGTKTAGPARLSVILWITFLGTVVTSGPMLTYAWNYSDHQPGTWAEEDFFFLLQGSIMQIFSLVVTGITLSRSKSVPVTAWALPSIFAMVTILLSPVLYCFVPKWWSSFCTIIAGSIQAFMVLQLALYGV